MGVLEPPSMTTVPTIHQFLMNDLPRKLTLDLKSHRIIKEADLECRAYLHIANFLDGDDRWRCFARKHSIHTRYYSDFLIFQGTSPRVAIELKWNCNSIAEKDRTSLSAAIEKLHVNRAYFITTLVGDKEYSRVEKIPIESVTYSKSRSRSCYRWQS
jgi:hypothetical protein